MDQMLGQIEKLRRVVNNALSREADAGPSPTGRLRGIRKRLSTTKGPSEKGMPSDTTEAGPLDATQILLLDIEAHLYGIRETIQNLINGDRVSGGFTDPQARVLQRLKRSVKLSLVLIGNAKILAFPGGMENQPRSVRLSDTVRRLLSEIFDLYNWEIADQMAEFTTAEDLTILAAKAGVTLQIEAGLLDRPCVLDPDKFGQIMVNLLLNALKFRKEAVWLSVTELKNNLMFTVSDDGGGMSEEVRKAVMAGRFQAGPDEGLPIKSHGIGLAGAHALIKEMGGKLAIESTPGKGTRVSVTLSCEKG